MFVEVFHFFFSLHFYFLWRFIKYFISVFIYTPIFTLFIYLFYLLCSNRLPPWAAPSVLRRVDVFIEYASSSTL